MIPIYPKDFAPFLNNEIFCIKTLGIFKYNYNRIKAERIELKNRGKLYLQDEESVVMTSLRLIEEASTRCGRILDYDQCRRSQSYAFYGSSGKITFSYERLDDVIKLYKYYILGIGGLEEYLGINERHYLDWLKWV